MYNPSNDTWTETNELNEVRHLGSGCQLGDKLYVFGGASEGSENTMEYFNESEYLSDVPNVQWILIQFPDDGLKCGSSPMVSKINETEIVILGGV